MDSSVTPWISWTGTDDGPDFVGAPLSAYTLDGTTDPREPVPGGPLLEIPLSSGYSRWPFDRWHGVYGALRRPWARPLRLGGIAVRLGIVRAIMISPEVSSVRDMLRLAGLLVSHGVSHLSCFFHSPSLCPGLSQFNRTTGGRATDVRRHRRVRERAGPDHDAAVPDRRRGGGPAGGSRPPSGGRPTVTGPRQARDARSPAGVPGP